MNGYGHSLYAHALGEVGTPRQLPRCGGWILQRQIPGFGDFDAMGCYPLFVCQDWSQLAADLEEVGSELVTLVAVTDPFGSYTPLSLQGCFGDQVIAFKEHFVIDLQSAMRDYVANHHQRNADKALRLMSVEHCENALQHLDEWLELYANLIQRHQIRGLTRFSKTSFQRQLEVPGLVMFRASYRQIPIGMLLWYVQGDIGYYHLGAYSDLGYELRASFGLFWYAIEAFGKMGLRWLNLGAGAGIQHPGSDGLARFKGGWATETRTAYLCGRIFNHARYADICGGNDSTSVRYFPAYRYGEFASGSQI